MLPGTGKYNKIEKSTSFLHFGISVEPRDCSTVRDQSRRLVSASWSHQLRQRDFLCLAVEAGQFGAHLLHSTPWLSWTLSSCVFFPLPNYPVVSCILWARYSLNICSWKGSRKEWVSERIWLTKSTAWGLASKARKTFLWKFHLFQLLRVPRDQFLCLSNSSPPPSSGFLIHWWVVMSLFF